MFLNKWIGIGVVKVGVGGKGKKSIVEVTDEYEKEGVTKEVKHLFRVEGLKEGVRAGTKLLIEGRVCCERGDRDTGKSDDWYIAAYSAKVL